MDPLLLAFAALGALLWIPSVGYLAALELVARRRSACAVRPAAPDPWPRVTVVVPTLDEARWIGPRLANLRALDYPRDRLEVCVVDGGSGDGTVARVEEAMAAGAAVRLLALERGRGKMDQLRHAFEKTDGEIVVVTDADVALAPETLRELVVALGDPGTGLVGAWVEPETPLLEERIHWWLLNRLWWREGELFGAAGVAGPCYALRRAALPAALSPTAVADDLYLARAVGQRGFAVRRCPSARARELRVPRSLRELVRFRRRRRGPLLDEIHAGSRQGRGSLRALSALRRFQLRTLPVAALAWAGAAPLLLGAEGLALVAAAAATASLPLWATLARAPAFHGESRLRIARALVRLAGATAFALVAPRGRRADPGRSR